MSLGNALDDRQTQAAARRIGDGATPIEPLEDVRLVGWRYADARILDPDPQPVTGRVRTDR